MSDDLLTALKQRFGEDYSEPCTHPDTALARQILARGSVRAYSDRAVDASLLDLLSATALAASSKSDFQQVAIINVADDALRRDIGAQIPAMPWVVAAPVFLVFCGDARRIEKIGALHGAPVRNSHLEGFFNATVDAALAMQTFILAAESAGLGCCPISAVRNKGEQVCKLLGLPNLVFPVAGLCVGHPLGPARITPRLPPSAACHRDRYDDRNFEASIAAYDAVRAKAIALNPPRGPGLPGGDGKQTWSQEKAKQAEGLEARAFSAYLRGHGFLLD
jgi:nitroreductase